MFDLTGKNAIITGSSKGIGKSIAIAMAQQGANVVISSRKADVCEATAEEINSMGLPGKAIVIPCNISDKTALEMLVEETRSQLGQIDILVSTPIIEVGVDIPNASLIVINSAERFGISQLHQLRGRVGRGDRESKCIIVSSDEINELTEKRMMALVKSNDGFALSEEDLKIRGPGEIDKTKQSGWSSEYRLADPLDFDLIRQVNSEAESLIDKDPTLNLHNDLKKVLKNASTADINLG